MSYLTTTNTSSSSSSRGGLHSSASSSSSSSAPSTRPPPPASSDRLYVGNLSPQVDEYTLIQIFQKFGKIAKMDFLFHKIGPMKGKPRGFAFVEFVEREDAERALLKLNEKVLRGRKLVITFASQQPPQEYTSSSSKPYRRKDDPIRTTTLSLIKSQRRPSSPAAQIAALEAKLSAMKGSPLTSSTAAVGSSSVGSIERVGEGKEGGGDGELKMETETEGILREIIEDGGHQPFSPASPQPNPNPNPTLPSSTPNPILPSHLPTKPSDVTVHNAREGLKMADIGDGMGGGGGEAGKPKGKGRAR